MLAQCNQRPNDCWLLILIVIVTCSALGKYDDSKWISSLHVCEVKCDYAQSTFIKKINGLRAENH